jgi:hypothetical protein
MKSLNSGVYKWLILMSLWRTNVSYLRVVQMTVFLFILTAIYLVRATKRVFKLVRISLLLLERSTDVIIN